MQAKRLTISDIDALLPKGNGATVLVKSNGGVLDTVRLVHQIFLAEHGTMGALASALFQGDFITDCLSVYQFITENIRYRLDEDNVEQVRTPLRSWADRLTGVDCEDYTIIASSLIAEMGYEPRAEVVAFNNQPNYAHIFCVAYSGGQSCVVDPTPNPGQGPVPFNTRPNYITKTMEIKMLSGLPALSGASINGLGCIAPATPATQSLMSLQRDLVNGTYDHLHTPKQIASELRKLRYGIQLNGTEDQKLYLDVLYPEVVDITMDGNFIFNSTSDLSGLAAKAEVYSAWADTNYNPESTLADFGIEGQELGRIKTPRFVKYVGKKASEVGKKVIKNPLNSLNRFNPATVVIRNGLLLALRLNVFKMSSRLKYGYLTTENATEKQFNLDEHRKLKKVLEAVEKIFFGLGGKKENLRETILKGGKGLNGLSGLGEPATAGTAAAGSVIAVIVAKLKSVDFGKMFDQVKGAKALIESVKPDPNEKLPVDNSAQGGGFDSEEQKQKVENMNANSKPNEEGNGSNSNSSNSWLLPAGLAAAGLIFFLKSK